MRIISDVLFVIDYLISCGLIDDKLSQPTQHLHAAQLVPILSKSLPGTYAKLLHYVFDDFNHVLISFRAFENAPYF